MAADYDKAKQEAAKLLGKFKITEPPIDPEQIAEQLGVDVVYADFKPEISQQISGYLEFLEDENARIVINSDISPKRKTFTIAHELAHFLLHRQYAQSEGYQLLPRSNHYSVSKPDVEREADAFAAALLAPKHLVEQYKDIASLPEMSKIFVTSEEMLKWRIHNIDRFGN